MRFIPNAPLARLSDGTVMPVGQAQKMGYIDRVPGFGQRVYSALPVTGIRQYIPLKIVSRKVIGPSSLPQTTNSHYLPTTTDSVTGGIAPNPITGHSVGWRHHIQDIEDNIPIVSRLSNFFSLPNPFRSVS